MNNREFWLTFLGMVTGALVVVLLVYLIVKALYSSVTGGTSELPAPGIFGWVQKKAAQFRDYVLGAITGRTGA